jgi:putative heme-binding domain-containing protein
VPCERYIESRASITWEQASTTKTVGPDLSTIGRSMPREKIITSILRPSQEIAPDYHAWILVTDEGNTCTGPRMPRASDNGKEDYVDSFGKPFMLHSSTIEVRQKASKSIMPEPSSDAFDRRFGRPCDISCRERRKVRGVITLIYADCNRCRWPFPGGKARQSFQT